MLLEFLLVVVQLLISLPHESSFSFHGFRAGESHIDVALNDLLEHVALDGLSVAVLGDLLKQLFAQRLLNLVVE